MSGELAQPGAQVDVTRVRDTYALVLPRNVTPGSLRAMTELPGTLSPGDSLSALAIGHYSGPGSDGRQIQKLKCLVAIVGEKLVVADERDPRNGVELDLAEWRYSSAGSGWIVAERGQQVARFDGLLPPSEAGRIQTRLGFEAPGSCYDVLGDFPQDPGHLPTAALGPITLYPDRLIDAEWRQLPFSGQTTATVDATGNIAVTRGRNLAHKALGTVAFGLPGMLLFGNAREYRTDARELYLLVDGPNWAITQRFDPNVGKELREFAQQINIAVRREHDEAAAAGSVSGELRELAALRDEGILSEEEFAHQKARLLKRS